MSELTDLRARVEALEEELSDTRDLVRAISRREVEAEPVDGRFGLVDVDQRGDALERSMQLMRTVFDGATDVIMVTDRRGRVVDANSAAGLLFGRGPGSLRGAAVVDLFEPSPTLDVFWREGGDARLSEQVTVRRADGARRIALLRALANVLPGVDMVLLHYQTAPPQAAAPRRPPEAALRTTEARFRAMVDRSPATVALLDAHATVLYASGGIEQLIGVPPVDLVLRPALHWIHPDDRSGVLAALALVNEPPRPARCRQFRVIDRDGQVRWVDCVATNRLDDPDVEGIIVHLVDVTEREAARQSQARSEARYRRFVEATTEGVLALDRDCVVVFANHRFGEMVGRAPASLIGRALDTLTDGALCARLRAEGDQPPATQRFEHAFRSADGRTIWTQLSAAPLRDDAGEVEGILVLASDTTDRRAAEEAPQQKEAQLRQSQKMEAIGSLAGGVAHDFNNLLSVILSYASLALEDLPVSSPLRCDLAEIRDAAERASGLTRQLLAFSRRQVLEPRSIDLNASVTGLQRMLSRLLGEHIVQRTTLCPDLPKVFADAGQIEQVIMNLVVNARDAMPTGGTLTVATDAVTLDADSAAARGELAPVTYVRLTVTDTGCGMDAATCARAFEPFFTTKPVGRGTGLGLATVFGIVQQSQGQVRIASGVGRGTRVEILLPAARGAEVSTPPTPVASAGGRRGDETILLVEDDPALRRIVRTILRREGYRVLDAADGETALRRCADTTEPVHLLLTDVAMPRMNGRELAERLRGDRPEAEVVYMSGYTEDAVVHHGVYEDRMHFVHKPIVPARLTAKVREALGDA